MKASQVLGQLPAGEQAWAVLDGARDPRIRGFVFDSRATRACLYRGSLTRELEDAAPWLLQLSPGSAYTERLFERFWGDSCGVVLSTALSMTELRRHLRRFLLARDPDGRTLVFRWYDPRVLRVYLPTLTADEAGKFFGFGKVSAFAAEAEEPGAFHLFRRSAEGVEARLIA